MKGRVVKRGLPALALLAALLAAGCGEEDSVAAAPPPVALTQEAVGHFCGMALVEHPGPKGQILLRGNDRPVWFSSARDAIAFTHLAEEAKAIRAIYVSDMGHAESWDAPGARNWVEARHAFFVLGSDRRGGMGAEEAVPFSEKPAAEAFVAEHGGRVLAFAEVPRDWALGDGGTAPEAPESPAAPQHAH
ncbi:nitrous oxide reductase accessory protein NosL [Siccirubricoccus sp. G192]|uniref:nitrous oxide reductase accessory protein NosL n=1 Tax=Siccirubricoccus sp. G192 TaxID=2849651 RepID=UPI001C2BED90|nr:nitrous oxide reductase accessory protein NosL [Siccirubricoccus sp. G192]MBV1795934.1 nitrous oxide reductase accessory protein NosL [Siccirubricoccus sp. G192]